MENSELNNTIDIKNDIDVEKDELLEDEQQTLYEHFRLEA